MRKLCISLAAMFACLSQAPVDLNLYGLGGLLSKVSISEHTVESFLEGIGCIVEANSPLTLEQKESIKSFVPEGVKIKKKDTVLFKSSSDDAVDFTLVKIAAEEGSFMFSEYGGEYFVSEEKSKIGLQLASFPKRDFELFKFYPGSVVLNCGLNFTQVKFQNKDKRYVPIFKNILDEDSFEILREMGQNREMSQNFRNIQPWIVEEYEENSYFARKQRTQEFYDSLLERLAPFRVD